jgi:hypothetical protein
MYRLSPSGDWMGQSSRNGVFSSELFPPISSIFWAGLHAEKWGPAEAIPSSTTTSAPASAAAWGADLFIANLLSLIVRLSRATSWLDPYGFKDRPQLGEVLGRRAGGAFRRDHQTGPLDVEDQNSSR